MEWNDREVVLFAKASIVVTGYQISRAFLTVGPLALAPCFHGQIFSAVCTVEVDVKQLFYLPCKAVRLERISQKSWWWPCLSSSKIQVRSLAGPLIPGQIFSAV